MERELTPKQLTSEALRQAESILILTGQHPSIDQVSATIALSAILRKFGKKVTAVISDEIPAGARFLPTKYMESELGGLRDFILKVGLQNAEVDKLKYTIENGSLDIHVTPFAGGFKPTDVSFDYGDYQFDVVVVLGVASYSRIDKVYGQNAEQLRDAPLINVDFHRSNEQYGAINLVESQAASLAEILVALSESLQTGMIDAEIAQVLLTGIVASTDRFTATHTTAKALTVAAQMMAAGADHQQVVRGLYKDRGGNADRSNDRSNDRNKKTDRPERPNREDAPSSAAAPKVERTAQPLEVPTDRPAVVKEAVPQERQVEPEAAKSPEPATEPTPHQPVSSAPNEEPKPATVEAAPLKASEPDIVATPTAAPIAAMPLPVVEGPAIDSDSPAVTDPDLVAQMPLSTVPDEYDEPAIVAPLEGQLIDQELEAEPLINSQDEPRPEPKPAPTKAPNPTNKPVFANRLSR
jgi:hypothetical protein